MKLDKEKTCCFSGHRSGGFDFYHSHLGKLLSDSLEKAIDTAVKDNATTFLTGMAMGFDIFAAEAVLRCKGFFSNPKMKLVCVLPYSSQSNKYPR
ncbi:MAG: DUF1273 domain-containing protein, partial [Defluviitaleaceae bacterium]|nr:DUF1273 domain-containing protein [Defluviitaleaceae bacterium]